MAFNKLEENVSILSQLDRTPNATTGMDYKWMQGKFDEAPNIIKDFINALIDAMASASGGTNIGITPISGVNVNTVQDAIAQLQQNILDSQQGMVADGSITALKLANLAVTTAKLAEMAVSTSKLATGAVTEPKLGAGAVTNAKIADGTIDTEKLSTAAKAYFRKTSEKVNSTDISGTMTANQIANGAVSTSFLATIGASAWTAADGGYTATVAVVGMKATDNPIADLDLSATADVEGAMEAFGNIYRIETANDSITAYATDQPTSDVTIRFMAVRK